MKIAPLPPRSSTSAPPLHAAISPPVMLLVTLLMLLLFNTCLSHNVVENLPDFQGKLPFKYGQFVSDHVIPYKDVPTNFLQSVAATRKSWCREDNHDLAIVWANLHVREGKKTDWILCNATIQLAKAHQEITPAYVKTVISTVDIHKKFTNKRCRALIYSGDHDLYIPHIATKKWIDVYLNVSIQSDWRPWFVDGQIAGYSVTYGESAYKLTYATVKGAGHTPPPEYKPAESLAMIQALV